MKKVLYILIAAISVMAFSGCGMKNTVQIGTGDVNGTYYAYGTELAEILNNNSDVYFKVRKTAGSAANLRLISQEYVDIAFVQSDVMKDAYNGTGYFDKEYKGYSAIAGLYTEAIQVAVPKDSDINSISDLYGKSVSLGEKESGVLQNSKQILSAYGLNESMVDAKYLSYTDAAKAMKNENLDAFFCTSDSICHGDPCEFTCDSNCERICNGRHNAQSCPYFYNRKSYQRVISCCNKDRDQYREERQCFFFNTKCCTGNGEDQHQRRDQHDFFSF